VKSLVGMSEVLGAERDRCLYYKMFGLNLNFRVHFVMWQRCAVTLLSISDFT